LGGGDRRDEFAAQQPAELLGRRDTLPVQRLVRVVGVRKDHVIITRTGGCIFPFASEQ
jgi:hypothetical protein